MVVTRCYRLCARIHPALICAFRFEAATAIIFLYPTMITTLSMVAENAQQVVTCFSIMSITTVVKIILREIATLKWWFILSPTKTQARRLHLQPCTRAEDARRILAPRKKQSTFQLDCNMKTIFIDSKTNGHYWIVFGHTWLC